MYKVPSMGPGTELTLPLLPIALHEPASVPLFLLSHERVPEVPSGANLVIPTSILIIGVLGELVYPLAACPNHRSSKEPMTQIAAGSICDYREGRTEARTFLGTVHMSI